MTERMIENRVRKLQEIEAQQKGAGGQRRRDPRRVKGRLGEEGYGRAENPELCPPLGMEIIIQPPRQQSTGSLPFPMCMGSSAGPPPPGALPFRKRVRPHLATVYPLRCGIFGGFCRRFGILVLGYLRQFFHALHGLLLAVWVEFVKCVHQSGIAA